MNLLIDTNVIMDVFTKREPFFDNSKTIFDLCVNNNKIQGNLASYSISNLWYLLRKTYNEEELRILLLSVCQLFNIVDLNHKKLISALKRKNFTDFEDCLQDECAKEIFCDYIITRNTQDYKNSNIKAISPKDFLKLIS